MTEKELLKDWVVKESKEALKDVTLDKFNNGINNIKNGYDAIWHIGYTDYNTGSEYVIAIGAYEEDNEQYIFYKYGYIGKHTMVLDIDDILMPYDEVNNEIYDTQCTIGDSVNEQELEDIKNGFYDFIGYCVDNNIIEDF